jgi:hypothetical protein
MESLCQGKDAIHDDFKTIEYTPQSPNSRATYRINQRKQWIFIRRRQNSSHWPRSQSRANINILILHMPQLIRYWRITSTSLRRAESLCRRCERGHGYRHETLQALWHLNEVCSSVQVHCSTRCSLRAFSPSPHRSFGMNFFQLAPLWEASFGLEARGRGRWQLDGCHGRGLVTDGAQSFS